MKKAIMMLAALAPFAAIIAADKPEKSPEEESAEKAVRVRAMAAEYAPCTVNVRFRLKPSKVCLFDKTTEKTIGFEAR